MAELITPKASITIAVRTPDGRTRQVEANVYAERWDIRAFRDYEIGMHTRRAMMKLLENWETMT